MSLDSSSLLLRRNAPYLAALAVVAFSVALYPLYQLGRRRAQRSLPLTPHELSLLGEAELLRQLALRGATDDGRAALWQRLLRLPPRAESERRLSQLQSRRHELSDETRRCVSADVERTRGAPPSPRVRQPGPHTPTVRGGEGGGRAAF